MEDIKSKGEIAESSTINRQSSESLSILSYSKLTVNEKEYFKSLFEKYDRDGNGSIDIHELATMLRENNEVSEKLLRKLLAYSDRNRDGKVDVHEFTAMMLNKNFKILFGDYVNSYVDFLVPKDKRHKFRKVGRSARQLEEGQSEVDGGGVLPKGSCWPPPLCMVLVAIIEIICYSLNEHLSRDEKVLVPDVEGAVAKLLIYDPEKREECWRFLSYMLVHIGWTHLLINLLIQIILGVALEFRNRWYRVFTVYAAGVIAGSLVTSITDPTVYLAGASGGVYALLTAHLANIFLNWSDLICPAVQLGTYLFIIICDVSSSVYNRHAGDSTPIGYAAHFGGALAGFLVGISVLKNVEPTEKERYIWWAAFVVYIILMLTAILLNIFWKSHFL